MRYVVHTGGQWMLGEHQPQTGDKTTNLGVIGICMGVELMSDFLQQVSGVQEEQDRSKEGVFETPKTPSPKVRAQMLDYSLSRGPKQQTNNLSPNHCT